MVFFFKMGLLVCMTILFSVIYSLGFFMALCVLWGPEHDTGNTRVMLQRWFGNGKTTSTTAVVQDTNNAKAKDDPKEVEMAFTTNEHFKHELSGEKQEDIIV